MGFPSSEHIQRFVEGQIIKRLYVTTNETYWLEFESGEKLRFYTHKDGLICTPYSADGSIKQSLDIMATKPQEQKCPVMMATFLVVK